MSNDGFIDKAGDAARKVFGSDEQRYAGGSYAAEQPRRVATDYPMGGDDAALAQTGSHQAAQPTTETQADVVASSDRARQDDVSNEQAPGQDPSSLALGESPSQGSDGPHILDRSFSGTYDKD